MSNVSHYDFTEEEVVNYIINSKCSLREAAKHFGCSKDTISRKIKKYNGKKKEEVLNILDKNLKESRF